MGYAMSGVLKAGICPATCVERMRNGGMTALRLPGAGWPRWPSGDSQTQNKRLVTTVAPAPDPQPRREQAR